MPSSRSSSSEWPSTIPAHCMVYRIALLQMKDLIYLRDPDRQLRSIARRCRSTSYTAMATLVRRPARPHAPVDVLPVVQASAFDFTLVERKAERLDEMQRCARCEAGAACIAGVPMNLRMHEHDVCLQSSGARSRRIHCALP